MNKIKTSVFEVALIWFGAAVSIAEIETGSLIAQNGFSSLSSAIWAMVLGHILGGIALFAAGLIGARRGLSGMDSVKAKLGTFGGGFFSLMNILQLVGWTAVMIAQGAEAFSALLPRIPFAPSCIFIGVLVALWICASFRKVAVFNALLFVLTLSICVELFCGHSLSEALPAREVGGLGFWEILELSIAMPFSWLPLISDYTKDAKRPLLASLTAAGIYTLISSWMYGIGFCLVLFLQESSLASSMLSMNIGIAGVLVIVFSTVSTTFLDANSAGESCQSLFGKRKIRTKLIACIVCAIGIFLAIRGVMDHYLPFLYLLASIFAPMAAVLLADWFIMKRTNKTFSMLAWFVGFAIYHLCLGKTSPICELFPGAAAIFRDEPSILGATLPGMFAALCASLAQFFLPKKFTEETLRVNENPEVLS